MRTCVIYFICICCLTVPLPSTSSPCPRPHVGIVGTLLTAAAERVVVIDERSAAGHVRGAVDWTAVMTI